MAASGLVLLPVAVGSPTIAPSTESIQIYLATLGSNSIIPMQILSSDTIASVKLRIQAYKGFYTKQQRLVYSGRELSRDDCLITDYGVSHGEKLHLVLRLSDLVDVTVKTADGKEYIFQVEKKRNVLDLKRKISEKEGGLAPDAQQLILRGQNLEDQRCVEDLCLQDDAVVLLFVRRTAKVRTRYVGKDVELSITSDYEVVKLLGKEDVVNVVGRVQIIPEASKYTIPQRQPSYNDAGTYKVEEINIKTHQQTRHVLEAARGVLRFQVPDVLLDILAQAKAGLEGGFSPTLTSEGSGGAYFLRNSYGLDNVAIFKPVDEEPRAVNNPRGFSSSSRGEGLKKGTRVGQGAFREVAAYLLDHPIDGRRTSFIKCPTGFAGVPATMMVRCAHDAFHYAPDSWESDKKAKLGSLQQFVLAFSNCEEMGSSSFPVEEVHKIAVLDMRMANTDRNGGNILVCRDEYDSLRLVPIDHGYCLPEKVSNVRTYQINFIFEGGCFHSISMVFQM